MQERKSSTSVLAWTDWKRGFIERLRVESAANRAWSKIEQASKAGLNLDQVAAAILFQAVSYAESTSNELRRGLARQAHALKAALRADRKAKERSRDPRAMMFERRRTEALRAAGTVAWPFPNPNVKTFNDAAAAYPEIGAQTLEQAASTKSADGLRRWGVRKPMLAMLRAGLRAHGVTLSPRALSALAFCANPAWNVDERTLRRFFREPSLKRAEQAYVATFNSINSNLNQSLVKG